MTMTMTMMTMTMTMTTRRTSARGWRSLSGGAATSLLVVVMLVASACSDTSTTTDAANPPSGADDGSSATTRVAGSSATLIGDADELLSGAIAAVGTRYEFNTSVDLAGGTLTLVTGRIYDDASAYLITTVASELEYVITPDGRWVREPGDQWVTLQEVAPLVDPLSILAAPTTIEVLAVDDTTVTMAASYLGATLGFPDTEDVTIELVITSSRLTSLRYQAAAGPDIATVETEISTALDITRVTAPIPAG